MSVNEIVNGFLKPYHHFDIKYNGNTLTADVINKDKATSESYTTDFKQVKHEAFTKFNCGLDAGGYCNKGRACNDAGKCGDFQTHFKQDGINAKYRECTSTIDKNCIDRTFCTGMTNCIPLYRK